MNSEEIKQQYSMRDIVEQYGYKPNRAGFISCPFHTGDRSPSMKIYPKDFHCHACGANGDIFTFIQKIDQVDFKTAFQSLGGTYEKPTFESQLAIYRAQKKKEQRIREEEKLKRRKELNNMLIDVYRYWMNRSEPFSETWCSSCNALQYQLYLHEILNGEEVRQ